jgi:hypothetical protein
MTQIKHTPGPWHIAIDDDGSPLSGRPSVCAYDELDCMIVHWDGFVQQYWRSARGDKEIHANARLIAAAPDPLEALEDIIAELDWTDIKPLPSEIKARTAIAKAKGQNT